VQLAGQRLKKPLAVFNPAVGAHPHGATVIDAVLGEQDSITIDQ
jgi:hypothetical protein